MIHTGQRLRNRQTAGYVLLIISLLLILLYTAATVTADNRKKSALLQATPTVSFSRTNYEVTEGNRATITVEISPSPTITASVRYETLNGTAQSGTDYIPASGFLDFSPGDTSTTFQVQTRSRSTFVGDRTVILRLSDPTNADLDPTGDAAVLTILEDQAPTATPRTPTPVFVDLFEPNNTLETAYPTSVGADALCDITLWPSGDVDWFRFTVKEDDNYEALTSDLSAGLDTVLTVYDNQGREVDDNDDFEFGSLASRVEFSADASGTYYAQIVNKGGGDTANRTYCFEVNQVQGPPTSTPLPTSTRVPGADICEYNGNFDSACLIGAGDTFDMNFVPIWGEGTDNDFYRIWVKPGLFYNCETFNLSSVNDTNMILYDQNQNGIGGNDDRAPGDFGSQVSFFANYTGWLFVLVGPVAPPEYALSFLYTYSLRCTETVATPTATPRPTLPPSSFVPKPPTSTPSPSSLTVTPVLTATAAVATPTFTPNVQVQPLPTNTPVVAPGREISFEITVYFDENLNFTPELTEGVEDVGVSIYDNTTNELLAFGYTNEAGTIRFSSLTVSGMIRVSIPFLQFDQIAAGDSNIFIRVSPFLR
ncbi:MAG: Calx-beta domain-containing protein [Chloroflexota bacterium]|jgi:hypothetical protein